MRTKILLVVLTSFLLNCNNSDKNLNGKSNAQLEKSMQIGANVYTNFCVSCHLDSGTGVPKVFPPLADSDYLKNNRLESIKGIKYGQKGEIIVNGITYNSYMAPMGLSNKEIADVMNYINNSWGNNYGEIVTEEEVANITK